MSAAGRSREAIVDEVARDDVRIGSFPEAGRRLGEGEEAEVYALGDDRVLRFYKRRTEAATLERRRAFHAALAHRAVTFAVPEVLDLGVISGVSFTVERRIPGISLEAALPAMAPAERRRAWVAYADAAAAVAALGCPPGSYGELLAADASTAETWLDFAMARAAACLAADRARVVPHIAHPERALARLRELLEARGSVKRELVHGDFYPANIIVEPSGRVTGVIDFGPLTLAGDSRMDAAGALLYLAGMPGVMASDRETVARRLGEHGLTEDDVARCRLFTAFRFLDTPRQGLFLWCVATIRAAC